MESIKQITDRYSNDDETMNEYLVRIGAKNNNGMTEEMWMQECNRDD